MKSFFFTEKKNTIFPSCGYSCKAKGQTFPSDLSPNNIKLTNKENTISHGINHL